MNYKQRLENLLARRELSKQKREVSKQTRLSVNMNGFKTYYEQ